MHEREKMPSFHVPSARRDMHKRSWVIDHGNSISQLFSSWASLVVQWLRICSAMKGTLVQSLVQEDPSCHRATEPMPHNYWSPCALEPVLHLQQEESPNRRRSHTATFLTLSCKGSACKGRRPQFSFWVGKVPWRRERLPTPVFWPGEFHGLYSPWGHKESDTTEQLSLSHCNLRLAPLHHN